MINLGDGYELLKVDDPYDGMGVASVTTNSIVHEKERIITVNVDRITASITFQTKNGTWYEYLCIVFVSIEVNF